MEFEFDLKFLKSDANGISVWNSKFQREFGLSVDDIMNFSQIVDEMGRASCKAQGLGQPVTSSHLLQGTNHKLYIICDTDNKKVKGILKIGYKKLFIHNLDHQYVEMTPLCVLDFYIHESYQRKGIGKFLFEFMLKSQNIEPRLIAYDAPSPKLLNFLNKYYGLKSFMPQNCNFVVYYDYFQQTDNYHYQMLQNHILPQSPKKEESQQSSENTENSERKVVFKDVEDLSIENEQKAEEQKIEEQVKSKLDKDKKGKTTMISLLFQDASDCHESQLDWIQKQIEQTKLELCVT